ncbi:hypothetical protein [Rahnella bonaserana]
MAKLTWFTYDTVMTTIEADTLIKKYTSQNIQTQKQLSDDYTGWYVSALLPEFKNQPRQSSVWQNPMWR